MDLYGKFEHLGSINDYVSLKHQCTCMVNLNSANQFLSSISSGVKQQLCQRITVGRKEISNVVLISILAGNSIKGFLKAFN